MVPDSSIFLIVVRSIGCLTTFLYIGKDLGLTGFTKGQAFSIPNISDMTVWHTVKSLSILDNLDLDFFDELLRFPPLGGATVAGGGVGAGLGVAGRFDEFLTSEDSLMFSDLPLLLGEAGAVEAAGGCSLLSSRLALDSSDWSCSGLFWLVCSGDSDSESALCSRWVGVPFLFRDLEFLFLWPFWLQPGHCHLPRGTWNNNYRFKTGFK